MATKDSGMRVDQGEVWVRIDKDGTEMPLSSYIGEDVDEDLLYLRLSKLSVYGLNLLSVAFTSYAEEISAWQFKVLFKRLKDVRRNLASQVSTTNMNGVISSNNTSWLQGANIAISHCDRMMGSLEPLIIRLEARDAGDTLVDSLLDRAVALLQDVFEKEKQLVIDDRLLDSEELGKLLNDIEIYKSESE